MSEARKKLKEEVNEKLSFESGKEIIDRIRKEKQKEVLKTGKHWVLTANGIPYGQFTTEEIKIILRSVVDDPNYVMQVLGRIEILDLLTDKKFEAKELMERYSINWRR